MDTLRRKLFHGQPFGEEDLKNQTWVARNGFLDVVLERLRGWE